MCDGGLSLGTYNLNVEMCQPASYGDSHFQHGLNVKRDQLKIVIQGASFQVIRH